MNTEIVIEIGVYAVMMAGIWFIFRPKYTKIMREIREELKPLPSVNLGSKITTVDIFCKSMKRTSRTISKSVDCPNCGKEHILEFPLDRKLGNSIIHKCKFCGRQSLYNRNYL